MARMRTVLQVIPALDAGGAERSCLEIADALVRAGHRADVLSSGGRLVPQLSALGARHFHCDLHRKALTTLCQIGTIKYSIQQSQPDIIHVRSRLPAWLIWLALRQLDLGYHPHLVTTVHGLNSPGHYSAIMTRGECVICVSQTVYHYICQHYPQVPRSRLRVIPRGVDPIAFPRQVRPNLRARAWAVLQGVDLPANRALLLLPGRGSRLKGHADALQLLADLRAHGHDVGLWLLGVDQTHRQAYLRSLWHLANRLNVYPFVTMSQPIEQISLAYAASDLVLQVSRQPEAFGRTVLEALAVGCPVVGWAHGGVGELLQQWQPQGLVSPFDRRALWQTASALLADPGPIPATVPCSVSMMQTATLQVYDEICA